MKTSTIPRRSRAALAVLSVLAGAHAYAQSTTSTIFGRAPAQADQTVSIRGSTGLSRTVPVDVQGRYTAPQLPVGTYTVTLMRGGKQVQTRDNISLKVGIGADVSFDQPPIASSAEAQNLAAVNVRGNALPRIDVSSVDSRTVITSEQLAKLPLGRNAEAAALLSPGATSGAGGASNPATGEPLVSFGGSAASENAYYINGFNTTDPFGSLGGIELPYGSIDQEEVYTGGYSAQYGRSDGGVINLIGKSGTNQWHVGAQVLWTPSDLRAKQRDTYYRNGTPPNAIAGALYTPSSDNHSWTTVYDAYVGGPLIKDTLFLFASVESTRQEGHSVANVEAGTAQHYRYETPKTYAKLNWNITDSNLLELTTASERRSGDGTIYNYDYVNRQDGTFKARSSDTKRGGDMWTGKFTSYLTDSLTLTALFGKLHSIDYSQLAGYDPNLVYVTGNTKQNPAYTGGVPIRNAQTLQTIPNPDKAYRTRNVRLALTYTIGGHTITGGIDNLYSMAVGQGSITSGPGYYWSYDQATDPTKGPAPILGVGPIDTLPNGAQGYYVTKNVSTGGANLSTVQHAQYIEDQWQFSDRLLLSLGVRNDQFSNLNSEHTAYIAQTKPQFAPRLGFSWDVLGDSTFKVYGNAGRYYIGLPLAPGGPSNGYISTQQYYTYGGIAADGSPTHLYQVSGPVSANNAFGQAPDPRTITAKNINAENQDEFILGFTKTAGSSWVYGSKFSRRILRHILDDYCDIDRVTQKAAEEGIVDTNQASCYYINPGQANTFSVRDETGVFHDVRLSNVEMGNPHAKRAYYGLENFLEHPFDGTWYGTINYTFSRLYGNSEGQGQSDIRAIGGIQNEDWDFPELMVYANGPQGNDSTHQIKAYGYYQIDPEWQVSANLSLRTGGPKYCLGLFGPDNTDPAGYNSNYHFCNGQPSPPGKNGRLPWQKQLDLGVHYRPAFAAHKLAFSLDVFNVTNSQVATNLDSQLYENATGTPNYSYNTPLVLQPPRYVRLGASYDL